jgi:hypothetical protein
MSARRLRFAVFCDTLSPLSNVRWNANMIRYRYKMISVTAGLSLALLASQWCGVVCAFPVQIAAPTASGFEQPSSQHHCHSLPAKESRAGQPLPTAPTKQNHPCSHHEAFLMLSVLFTSFAQVASIYHLMDLPEQRLAHADGRMGRHLTELWDARRAPPLHAQHFILRI